MYTPTGTIPRPQFTIMEQPRLGLAQPVVYLHNREAAEQVLELLTGLHEDCIYTIRDEGQVDYAPHTGHFDD